MKLIEYLKIDGVPTAANTFVVPQMSLSSARATMAVHCFEFAIQRDALVEKLALAYTSWVVESRRDDGLCAGPQDALAVAGYPELTQVIEQPALLELVVGAYLLEDLLRGVTWNGCDPQAYWLDVVKSCILKDGFIYLRGVCYS